MRLVGFFLLCSSLLFKEALFSAPKDCSFEIGPELYHLQRERRGSKQTGWLFGGRASLERQKPQALFLALLGYLATGEARGRSLGGDRLQSRLTEYEVEGRIGYHWTFRPAVELSLIPFVGYGRFCSKNAFAPPSPIRCSFENRLEYASAGLKLLVRCSPSLSWGVEPVAKWVLEGRSRTSDPEAEPRSVELTIGEKMQYELRSPLIYRGCFRGRLFSAELCPFFRYRCYGGHEEYPFNFHETKFSIWGADLLFKVGF